METEQVKRKAQVFFEKKIPVHIVTNSDSWINGFITYLGSDFIMILDRIDKQEIPVFFIDIHIFETFEGDYNSLPKPTEGSK